jgi:hypothetical protein
MAQYEIAIFYGIFYRDIVLWDSHQQKQYSDIPIFYVVIPTIF